MIYTQTTTKEKDMLNILDKDNQIVDTVDTITQAHTLVTWLNVNERASAPYHCAPVVAA